MSTQTVNEPALAERGRPVSLDIAAKSEGTALRQEPLPEAGAYEFDVFVSCHETDKNWVEPEILAPLLAAGVKVTWEWGFAIGVDRTEARDQAVKNSRHTLLVLTQAWCRAAQTRDDALSSRFLDPNAANRKILPLLCEKCDLPGFLPQLVSYDFSAVQSRQETLLKLLVELGQSRQTVNEVMSQFAQSGIRALIELMEKPEVRSAVQTTEADFIETRDEIEVMERCKRMHEYFHRVDAEFLQFMTIKKALLKVLKTSPEDNDDWQSEFDEAWTDLKAFVDDKLNSCIQDLVGLLNTGNFPTEQTRWSEPLERAGKDLNTASENRDVKLLNRVSERLSPIIAGGQSRFDQLLFESAKRMRLSNIAGALTKIRDAASMVDFKSDVKTRLEEFSAGTSALSELGQLIQDLAVDHACLQYIDETMRMLAYPCKFSDDVEKIREMWPDLEPTMDTLVPISNSNWVEQIQATRKEVAQAIDVALRDEVDQETIGLISRKMGGFRSSVRTGFTQVDLELLNLCDRLRKIREELSIAIRNLQHE